MAGDWIKMRVGLERNIKLFSLADEINKTPDETIFLLYKLAQWFLIHGKHGTLHYEPDLIDLYLETPGIAGYLMEIGWLRENDGEGLTLHYFTSVSGTRKSLGKKVRKEILENAVCAACGSSIDLQIDHKIPVSRGGMCVRENFQPLCRACNSAKGKKTMDEFMQDRGTNGKNTHH